VSATFNVAQAYERGRVAFMGIELLVAPGALVPRNETELLALTAINALRESGKVGARVIDMCCGTGNLACAIALHVPSSRVWASDLTDACIAIARRNFERHSLIQRASVHQGDLFASFAGLGLEGSIDMILCNPPYISEGRLESDRAQLVQLEPREAFAAGPYGLTIHMRVAREAAEFLRPGGMLLFEVGEGQARQVQTLLARTGAYVELCIVNDALGVGRIVHACKGP